MRCPKTKRRLACLWGNLCVVKLRLEDEGVVNQKMYWIGKRVNRATYDNSIIGVRSNQGVLRRKCVAVFKFRPERLQ